MKNVDVFIDWFLNSKIYSGEGTYRSWYATARNGSIYPEVTAYAISLACVLFKEMRDERLLERAERCASSLIEMSREGEMIDQKNRYAYSFDTGIFVSSMLDLYELKRKKAYLTQAEKSLKWLLNYWNGRTFSDRVSKDGAVDSSSFINLAKLAIPLVKASVFLKDDGYKDMAVELLKWAEELQLENGRFAYSKAENKTMTHYHCYAAEGFLYAYHSLKHKRYLKVVEKAAEWLNVAQNDDGSFYQWYPKTPTRGSGGRYRTLLSKLGYKVKVTDATAQATRIWKVLGTNYDAMEKAYRYLESESKDGGLRLSRRGLIYEHSDPRIYSWPSFFYIHSLLMEFGCIEKAAEIF